MVRNLRPLEAAKALGCGPTRFWTLARTDPDFPKLIRLGPKHTIVREADLEAYLEKKLQQSAPGREVAAA